MSEQQQMSEHGQRVIRRAIRLMQQNGWGWSKAMDRAAESLASEPTDKKPKR